MKQECKINRLSASENGQIIYCKTCKKYHIEFNNLCFTFNHSEYKTFSNYFEKLDISSQQFRKNQFKRKIIIAIGHQNLNALFHEEEVLEMQKLLSGAQFDRSLPNFRMVTHRSLDVKLSDN